MAREPETPAGSESTARAEREANGTWEIHGDLDRLKQSVEYAN
jgi:hypothetical protein